MAEEQNPKENEEIKIDELDEKDLEDVSGGAAPLEEATNNGCNCSCG